MNSVFNQQYGGGFQYGMQQQPVRKWTNPLTKEQEQVLKQKSPAWTLEVPESQLLQSKCTHRDTVNHRFSVVPNEDGSYTCTKCGKTFFIVQKSPQEIETYVNGIVDILETAKMLYVDMPDDAITTYYQMIPFLEKLPKIYETAASNFEQLTSAGGTVQQANMFGSPFGMLSNVVGATPFMQQPMQMGQPMMMGQPMYQQPMQQMGQPMMMGGYQNGFVGTPGVNPANPFQEQQPMQMNQQQAVDQTQQTAGSQDQQVQVKKTFEI